MNKIKIIKQSKCLLKYNLESRLTTLMPEIIKVSENIKREINTSLLNNVIRDAYNLNLPPTYKGKRLKIYFSVQASTCPPTFNIQVNNK